MYHLIKRILFTLDPEHAHEVALKGMQSLHKLGLMRLIASPIYQPRTVMGLTFTNPVGLAAGLDKNADYVDALAACGFGFIEIGTVTPKSQTGNPRPRLFRLTEQQAIINRMGFNSKGIEHVVKRLEKTNYRGILGINLGKNKETPLEEATQDYLTGFRALWKFASYITINISSPNTTQLRDLQQEDYLTDLIRSLKQEQQTVFLTHKKYVPLVLKISPDMSHDEAMALINVLSKEQIDGVIATNTTTSRDGITNTPHSQETGGLSGRPLNERSTQMVKLFSTHLPTIPIIASGGMMDVESMKDKQQAGASLFQIYSGFIYQGPQFIRTLLTRSTD